LTVAFSLDEASRASWFETRGAAALLTMRFYTNGHNL
jgi:hypothetical protein